MVNADLDLYKIAGSRDMPEVKVVLTDVVNGVQQRRAVRPRRRPGRARRRGDRERGAQRDRRARARAADDAGQGAQGSRGRRERQVKNFDYVMPRTADEAAAAAAKNGAVPEGRRHRPARSREGRRDQAGSAREPPRDQGPGRRSGRTATRSGSEPSRRSPTSTENAALAQGRHGRRGSGEPRRDAADPQPRDGGRQPRPAPAVLVLPQRHLRLLAEGRHDLLRPRRREQVPRDLRQRDLLHRASEQPRAAAVDARRRRPRDERRAPSSKPPTSRSRSSGSRPKRTSRARPSSSPGRSSRA